MNLAYPLGKMGRKTSGYGPRNGRKHRGIDIGIPVGTDVISVADGKVVRSDMADVNGYGNFICVEHPNLDGRKLYSCYAHLSKRLKEVGDEVLKGDVIGKSGGATGAVGSGKSSGPHLHFEIRKNLRGDWENPESFVNMGKLGAKSQKTKELGALTRKVESKKFFDGAPIKIISTPDGHKKRSTGRWPNKNAYDIKAPIGTKIYSITSGKVVSKKEFANKKGNVFGVQLSIRGINGDPDAFYAHIDSVSLNVGDVVYPGDYIGKVTRWPKHPESSHVHVSVEDPSDVFDFMTKDGQIKNATGEIGMDDLLSKDYFSNSTVKGIFSSLKTALEKLKGNLSESNGQITEDIDRIKDIMKKIL